MLVKCEPVEHFEGAVRARRALYNRCEKKDRAPMGSKNDDPVEVARGEDEAFLRR